ncbi:hypothetical protein ABVT39_017275 [Epinephelus coioides]
MAVMMVADGVTASLPSSSQYFPLQPQHHVAVGQFALYCNALNNGKSTIASTTSKDNAIKCKSPKLLWKLSGYLLFTLLLARDVQLNPGPTAGDVGPNRTIQWHPNCASLSWPG